MSSGEPITRSGAFDQREGPNVFGSRRPFRTLAERRDVLVFSTPPLARELEVTGPVTVRPWVASDGPGTDVTAKLIDVHPPNDDYPQGFAMNLAEGILRCRYRGDWSRPSPMTPGEVYAKTPAAGIGGFARRKTSTRLPRNTTAKTPTIGRSG